MNPRAHIARAGLLAAAAAFAAATLAAGSAHAQSVFSLQGPGVENPIAGGRSRALGGAAIALADSLHASVLNPAATTDLRDVTFQLTLVPGQVWARDAGANRSWRDTYLSHVNLLFPMGDDWTFGAGLRVERSTRGFVRWTVDDSAATGVSGPVDREFRREGDHFAYPFTLARALAHDDAGRSRLSVALGGEYLAASRLEESRWTDSGAGGFDTSAELEENVAGGAAVLGLLLEPRPGLRLGAVYRHETTLEGDLDVRAEGVDLSSASVKVRYPRRVGLGAAVTRGRAVLAGDVVHEDWSSYGHQGALAAGDPATDDTWTWGAGVEWGRGVDETGGSRGGSPWRLGYRDATLPLRLPGAPRIHERTYSAGTGWIFGAGRGVLDVSAELSFRGDEDDHGARERVFRLSLSVSGREPWKKPDRRGGGW